MTMRIGPIACQGLLAALVILGLVCPASAADLEGRVVGVVGQEVEIELDTAIRPRVGDEVTIAFQVPGGSRVRVATGRVARAVPGGVVATLVEVRWRPVPGQVATIRTEGGGEAPGPAPAPRTGQATGAGADITAVRIAEVSGLTEYAGSVLTAFSRLSGRTMFPMAAQAAGEYAAEAIISVPIGQPHDGLAGMLLSAGEHADRQVGDVLLARLGPRAFVLGRYDGEQFQSIEMRSCPPPATASAPVLLAVVRQGRGYEFRVDGCLLGTWTRPDSREDWVRGYLAREARAEFRAWRVQRLGSR